MPQKSIIEQRRTKWHKIVFASHEMTQDIFCVARNCNSVSQDCHCGIHKKGLSANANNPHIFCDLYSVNKLL